MRKVGYSKYTIEELYEALETIDKSKAPENYEQLQKELAKPERNDTALLEQKESESIQREVDFKYFFSIGIGCFFLFWSYLAYEKGVLHEYRGTEVAATLEDNPKEFMAKVYMTIFIGVMLIFVGAYGLYRNTKT